MNMEHGIEIAGRRITRDGSPLIIAEIGVNHDGDMGVARALVEAAKHAGADAVKFQLFEADQLLAREAGLVEYQKPAAGGGGVRELLQPLELIAGDLAALVACAKGLNMAAVVTPFSPGLVNVALACGAQAIKLASPDLVNRPLLEEAMATRLPLILSTGAARMDEIAETLAWLGEARSRTVLLHCVSSYPTPPEQATLAAIRVMRTEWQDLPIGYSDHTTDTFTGALAVAAGACVLEKHLTLDRNRRGPDHAASLELPQFREYVSLAKQAYVMRGPYAKGVLDIEREVRQQTRQSVAAAKDLAAGTILRREDLTVMRPGTGIPAAGLKDLIGRKLLRQVGKAALMQFADLGDPED